jgi:sulfatase maturation enzyme AslB (radical SAM superfamily)
VNPLKIQWQIGNQCNFRCDYCHGDYHDGSNPMLDHEQVLKAFGNLKESITSHEEVHLEFLGGEPTISRPVREIITSSNDQRFKFDLTTNASADLDWWRKASPHLNTISLAWHGMGDTTHFLEVVKLLSSTRPVTALPIVINAEPWTLKWARAVEVYNQLKQQGHNVKLKLLFANHNKGNNRYLNYSQDQFDFWTKENNIEVPEQEKKPVEWVENQLYTDYKGHLCWAGVDQIVIDYFGYVYRGWCKVGSGYGNIFDKPFKLDSNPKVCTRVLCKNGFDQQAKKSEKGWGL